MNLSKRLNPPISMRIRLRIVMFGCVLLSSIVLSRAVLVQVVPEPRLERLAKKQFQSRVLLRPRRGGILDRNGEPLAINVETQSLAANPSKVKNKRSLAKLLSKAIELPVSKTIEKLNEKREFVWLKRHLSENEVSQLKKWQVVDFDGDYVDGLWTVKESKRVYPHRDLASHILGDVNLDSEGLEGLELYANAHLQGKVAAVSAIRDALGRPAFLDAEAAKGLQEGNPLELTIDASLQFSVEQDLKNAVAKHGAKGGSVIVMNAMNGEILAMANEPSFDPNSKSAAAAHRRNRAVTDGYEPGSTMKPLLLATAINYGAKLSDTVYGEKGSFVIQGKRISEAEAHEKFEWISLKKMIQVSSNVGAAKLALKVGADKYFSGLKSFGFGTKTNLTFPGEISGKVPPRKNWQPLALANIGFGQGILVSPIQMTRAYAALANGGWLIQPSLIKTSMKGIVPEPPKRIFAGKVSDQVVEAMLTVTEESGTGIKAKLEGYDVAGKTGTAQKVDPSMGAYSRSKYVASFIGFAVGVEPRIVIFAALDEPKGLYYASETAAPLFKSVLASVASRFSLPAKPDAARTLAQSKANPMHHPNPVLKDRLQWSLAKVIDPHQDSGESSVQWDSTRADGTVSWKMPSLHGLSAMEAIQILQGHKFGLDVQGAGLVKFQTPEPGKTIADGQTIKLTLSEP